MLKMIDSFSQCHINPIQEKGAYQNKEGEKSIIKIKRDRKP